MKWIWLFLALGAAFASTSMLEFLARHSIDLQRDCANLIPASFIHQHLSQSFLCGLPLRDAQSLEIFRQTGLLHLMVVSGSHLQILGVLALSPVPKNLRQKNSVRFFLYSSLLLYCMYSGFQAPVVRAFTARLLSELNQKFSWNWDAGKIQLAAGVFLLAAFPMWISSFSFYLSWLASLGFLLTPLCHFVDEPERNSKWKDGFIACALIQSFMSVFFGQFSILSLLMNALLAPLIAITLLPLSILAVLIPASAVFVDSGWDFLLFALQKILGFAPTSDVTFPSVTSAQWIFLWTFLASLHCFFQWLRQNRYQKSYV